MQRLGDGHKVWPLAVAATVVIAVSWAAIPCGAVGPTQPLPPTLTIDMFREVHEVTGMATTTATGAAPASPTSSRIDLGEDVLLGWAVTGCRLREINLSISGIGPVAAPDRRDTGGGCFRVAGRTTVRPTQTSTYQLTAAGVPLESARVAPAPTHRSWRVDVLRPALDILQPVVSQSALTVELAARNQGDGRFLSNRIAIGYSIAPAPGHHSGAGAPFESGMLTVGPMEIAPGHRVNLGTITLTNRDALFAQEAIYLSITLDPVYPVPLGATRESFTHRWQVQTFTVNDAVTRLISMASNYDVRLNNYGPGGTHVANDSRVELNVVGHGASLGFNIPRFTREVLIAGPPLGIPVRDEVAIFVNQIRAAQRGPSDLFFIRDGKLGVHLAFANAAQDEIKTGMLFGPHDEWRDDMVADVNLSAFTIDVLLTPEFRNGAFGYSRVEVLANGVDASMVGALDALINTFFHDYLRRYVRDTLVTYLTQVLQGDDVRSAISGALNEAVRSSAPGMTRILGVRGSGNSIVITYL